MWAQLLTALLDWLTKLVKTETRKTGVAIHEAKESAVEAA